MGQLESSQLAAKESSVSELVSQLSTLEVAAVSEAFKELHARAGSGGHVVNLEQFSRYFKLPVLLGERLFAALDWKRTNSIDFDEFIYGIAMLLHGSFHDKCQLLFSMFNISGGAGIDRQELSTMLSIILSSTQLVLKGCGQVQDSGMLTEGGISEIVVKIVEQAFLECDVSRTNKLSPAEFEMWLEKNPELVEHLVKWTLPTSPQLLLKLGGSGALTQEEQALVESKRSGFRDQSLQPASDSSSLSDSQSPHKPASPLLPPDAPVPAQGSPIRKTTSELEQLDAMETIPDSIPDCSPQETASVSPQGSCSDEDSSQPNSRLLKHLCPHFLLSPDERGVYSTLWIPGVVTREAMQQRKYINQHPIPQELTSHEAIAPHKIEARLTDFDIRVSYQPRLSLSEVEMCTEGLEKLVEVGNFIDALHLTRELILQTRSISPQQQKVEYSPLILQLWLARFSLMLRLGLWKEMEDELERLAGSNFDRPDMYFEFYPERYPGKCGWMVPFGLVLLHASLPQMMGEYRRSLDRLYYLLHTAQRVKQHILGLEASELAKSQGTHLWVKRINRIMLAIGNTFITMEDFYNAQLIFSNMAKEQPEMKGDCALLLSKVHILTGNNSAAKRELDVAGAALECADQLPRFLLARGILEVAEKKYSQAEQTFRRLHELSPSASSINNIGFCLYYQTRVDEALEWWQTRLYSDAPESIHPSHISNIRSILGALPGSGRQTKTNILDVLAKRSPELIQHII